MFNTPTDCYNYIIENELEMPVLGAMMNHVGGYSIAEIADGRFHNRDGAVFTLLHFFLTSILVPFYIFTILKINFFSIWATHNSVFFD